MIIVTDGVTEAANSAGKMFGEPIIPNVCARDAEIVQPGRDHPAGFPLNRRHTENLADHFRFGHGHSRNRRLARAAAAAGVSWPLPSDWDARRLEEVVSGASRPTAAWRKTETPDFAAIRLQLQTHRNLTLQLVWEEYREGHREGYSYSHYVAAGFMLRNDLNAMTGTRNGDVDAT